MGYSEGRQIGGIVMKRIAFAALGLALGLASAPAAAQVYYTINGVPVDYATQDTMAAMGLPPGHYWLMENGNWGVMGNPQPMGNIYAGVQAGPGAGGGSGQINPDGSWSYDSPYTGGGGVGGTSDGCIYAFEWSNC